MKNEPAATFLPYVSYRTEAAGSGAHTGGLESGACRKRPARGNPPGAGGGCREKKWLPVEPDVNIPISELMFVQGTVRCLHARSDRFFDFVHAGQSHHCYFSGTVSSLEGMAPGQRVVMRGRWSRAVLQVFEADAVRVLPRDYGVPGPALLAAGKAAQALVRL